MCEETNRVFYMAFALKGLFGFFFILEVTSSEVGASSDAGALWGLGPTPLSGAVAGGGGRGLLSCALAGADPHSAGLACRWLDRTGSQRSHSNPRVGVACWRRSGLSSEVHVEALACAVVLLICVDMLKHVRGLSATASLCIMVPQIFLDMVPFLAILLTVLASLGLCLWLLLSPSATGGFSSILEALLSAFLMGVLGQFDTKASHDSQNPIIATTLFVLLETFVLIYAT